MSEVSLSSERLPQKVELQRRTEPAIGPRGEPHKKGQEENLRPEKPYVESVLPKGARRHDICKTGRQSMLLSRLTADLQSLNTYVKIYLALFVSKRSFGGTLAIAPPGRYPATDSCLFRSFTASREVSPAASAPCLTIPLVDPNPVIRRSVLA